MKTRIIVDSTADLVPEIKARVSTVPLTVHFGQEEYIDGVTIDNKTFYEKLIESDVLPTTSQATPDAFMKVWLIVPSTVPIFCCHHPCVPVFRHISKCHDRGGGV